MPTTATLELPVFESLAAILVPPLLFAATMLLPWILG